MAVRCAVSTYSLARWRHEGGRTLADALRWIADEGVDGVEFAGLDDAPLGARVARAEALKTLCDKLSLSVAGCCVGAELLTEPAAQTATVALLREWVDTTAALGTTHMRHDVTAGPSPTDSTTTMWEHVLGVVVPPIRTVADYAASHGVRTSVENHGFYLQTADRIEGLVRAVDHPNFAVTLDMGNFLCLDQDPVAAVQRLAPLATIVHAKDFHVRQGDRRTFGAATDAAASWFATPVGIDLQGAILGHGRIDVPAQLAALRASGYSGWISLEFEGVEEPTLGIRRGLQYLKEQLAIAGL